MTRALAVLLDFAELALTVAGAIGVAIIAMWGVS